jgi:beta-glucanase (GH16 family)
MTTPITSARFLALALVGLALISTGASCGEEKMTWQLVWEDEFTGAAGVSPDSTRWRFDLGTGWGNAQLEYDTSNPGNVSLDGSGHLAITARRENYLENEYTSGRINTRALFAQNGGRFEAKIRLPVGQGLWPAFWLLGADFESVGWPACGEIDIMEYRGQEPHVVHGSLHGPGYSGGSALTRRYDLPGVQGFDKDFHVFAIEWDSERVIWMVDGTPYHSVSQRDLPASGRWVFNHPFFIILNVAVGGNFVGPPNAATAFPQTMLIDWVRVYQAD